MKFIASFLVLLCTLVGPAQSDEKPLTVFAAASLRGALDAAARDFGKPVRLSFGGSGAMARQIAAGAPADVVILANTDWMDWLVDAELIGANQETIVAANSLVLIAPTGTAALTRPDDLPVVLGDGRLAMGQRDAVPAGSYAREWLMQAGLWDILSDRLAETENVRAALALVARAQAPYGIVYASDAQAEPDVVVVYAIPDDTHTPIVYPAAALNQAGRDFVTYLGGPDASAIFSSFGFTPAHP